MTWTQKPEDVPKRARWPDHRTLSVVPVVVSTTGTLIVGLPPEAPTSSPRDAAYSLAVTCTVMTGELSVAVMTTQPRLSTETRSMPMQARWLDRSARG